MARNCLSGMSMGIFEEQKTIVVKCNDQDDTLEDLLNYIKTNGNTGHSFSIVVDPKSPSMKTFGWDGDGSDSIKSINTSFKEWLGEDSMVGLGVDMYADQDPAYRPQNFSKHKVKVTGDKTDKKYGKKKKKKKL
jgi:hypothetical protein